MEAHYITKRTSECYLCWRLWRRLINGMSISLLSVIFPPMGLSPLHSTYALFLSLLTPSSPPKAPSKWHLLRLGVPEKEKDKESEQWWKKVFLVHLSVWKWFILCCLVTKEQASVLESDRCHKSVSLCVSVCLWVAFYFVVSGKQWHWILTRDMSSRFCVCVNVIVAGEPSAIKRHQNLCRTQSRQEGVWIFSWCQWSHHPIAYLPF